MPVGFPTKTTYANGDVFSADDINSTNGTINLLTSSTLSRAAAKNAIINGGYDIAQRGTSGTLTTAGKVFTLDRWYTSIAAGMSVAYSQQASTVAGTRYCGRIGRTAGNTNTTNFGFIQDVETSNSIIYAGQTITISFYARAGANFSAASSALTHYVIQGTGTDQSDYSAGFTGRTVLSTGTATLTTSFQRFSYTATVAATTTELNFQATYVPVGTAGANDYYEITGVQFELGSVATTFSRAGGTIQGELSACQRYYVRQGGNTAYEAMGIGSANQTTTCVVPVSVPVTLRTSPSAIDFSTLSLNTGNGAEIAVTACTILYAGTNKPTVYATVASGLTVGTFYQLRTNNSTSGYLGLSAEL
jgi:hypothetical protein